MNCSSCYLRSGFKVALPGLFSAGLLAGIEGSAAVVGEAGVMFALLVEGRRAGRGVSEVPENEGTGLGLLRRGRLHLFPRKIEGLKGLNKIIDKALAQGGDRAK